jgi:hypothetical protein
MKTSKSSFIGIISWILAAEDVGSLCLWRGFLGLCNGVFFTFSFIDGTATDTFMIWWFRLSIVIDLIPALYGPIQERRGLYEEEVKNLLGVVSFVSSYFCFGLGLSIGRSLLGAGNALFQIVFKSWGWFHVLTGVTSALFVTFYYRSQLLTPAQALRFNTYLSDQIYSSADFLLSIYDFPLWLSGLPGVQFVNKTVQSTMRRVALFASRTEPVENLPAFDYETVSMLDTNFLEALRSPRFKSFQFIRVLKLHRRLPFREVRATLVARPLLMAKIEKYDCISYVWGNELEKPNAIRLNGACFQVTNKVHEILQFKSSYFREKTIWIDSVCINQESTEEKTLQVRLMRDIYESASCTWIYLGQPYDAQFAHAILVQLRMLRWFQTPDKWQTSLMSSYITREKIKMVARRWKGFIELLHNPWFERVWCIQELVMSRNPNIIYGTGWLPWSGVLPWDVFLEDLEVLLKIPVTESSGYLQYTGDILVQRTLPLGHVQAKFLSTLRREHFQGARLPLAVMLREHSAWKATKGIDKVFALLSLSREGLELQHLIDYSRPVPETLLLAAKHFVKVKQVHQVLHYAGVGWGEGGRNAKYDDLPSWVVDWTVERLPTTLACSFNAPAALYRAGTLLPHMAIFDEESKVLRLAGFSMDRIKSICYDEEEHGSVIYSTSEYNYVGPNSTIVYSWLKRLKAFTTEQIPGVYPFTNQSCDEVLSRVFLGDRTSTERPAPEKYEEYFETFYRFVGLFRDGMNENATKSHEIFEPDTPAVLLAQELNSKFTSDGAISSPVLGQPGFPRLLAVTEKGYFGAIPKYSKEGDLLVVLGGFETPFVLREMPCDGIKKTYKLVGECYMHGLMGGEALMLDTETEMFDIL